MENVNGATDIITSSGEAHIRFRSRLSRAFSEQSLRTQEPRILSHIDLLIRELHKRPKLEGSVDLVQWFAWTVFDIMGDLAFGESFDCLKNGQLHPWIDSTFGSLETIILYFDVLRDYNLVCLASFFMPKSLEEARLENFKYASDTVNKRVHYGGNHGDFLDPILVPKDVSENSKIGNDVTTEELINNCSVLVSAGSL